MRRAPAQIAALLLAGLGASAKAETITAPGTLSDAAFAALDEDAVYVAWRVAPALRTTNPVQGLSGAA